MLKPFSSPMLDHAFDVFFINILFQFANLAWRGERKPFFVQMRKAFAVRILRARLNTLRELMSLAVKISTRRNLQAL
jgi:hypothetical protein